VVSHLGSIIVPSHPTLYRLNMWSSWVRRKGTTQVMYIAKLKNGPKRATKTFSMIWKRFFKWYDGGGENVSHPGSRKQNRSLHTCAQDVQITRTTNNMVNRYNISLNYKLESLQNDPWVKKKYYRVMQKSKSRCVFYRHNRRRGRSSLYFLAPAGTLGWTPAFCST
jgi:hypothetical protein